MATNAENLVKTGLVHSDVIGLKKWIIKKKMKTRNSGTLYSPYTVQSANVQQCVIKYVYHTFILVPVA